MHAATPRCRSNFGWIRGPRRFPDAEKKSTAIRYERKAFTACNRTWALQVLCSEDHLGNRCLRERQRLSLRGNRRHNDSGFGFAHNGLEGFDRVHWGDGSSLLLATMALPRFYAARRRQEGNTSTGAQENAAPRSVKLIGKARGGGGRVINTVGQGRGGGRGGGWRLWSAC